MVSYRVRPLLFVTVALALTVLLPAARAQNAQGPVSASDALGPTAPRDFSQDIPAHLAFVEGEVTLEREGKLEPAERGLALLAGDRVRTRSGRVEILYADGSTLAIDQDTTVDLLSDSLVRLLDGAVRVAILRTTDALDYRIDAPAGAVLIRTAGEYRVDTGLNRDGDPDVELAVVRGSAELVNDNGRTLVRTGRRAVTSADTAPSLPYTANSAAWDDFDRWVDDQRTSHLGSASAAYLPEEVQYYDGALDAYGTWGSDPSVGAVWYPRVATDWQPYSQGRWSYTGYYGWVWVGIDPWSWPTHHYGSWGYNNRWYWIPNHNWGPAWVSWAVSPGYVSWCPRGYDGRPVGGFPANGGYNYGEPWRTWTTLPAKQMTHNVWVTEHTVARNTMSPSVRDGFVERPAGPMPAGVATPRRAIAPLHGPTSPTNVAGPRNGHTSDAGVFDAARSIRPETSTTPRGPTTYAVPRSPDASADSRGRQVSPTASSDRPQAQPATPTGRTPPQAGVSLDRPQGPSPDRAQPRASVPSRAVMPRQSDPAPSSSAGADAPSQVRRAEPNRVILPAADPARDRGRATDRSAPPQSVQPGQPAQPTPPSASYPSRRSEPQAPPQAVPPPSRSYGGDRPAPPSAAPPTADAPARQSPSAPPPAAGSSGRGGGGGGGSQGQAAVPRRGGGGGGGHR